MVYAGCFRLIENRHFGYVQVTLERGKSLVSISEGNMTKNIMEQKIDKSYWGNGPWQNEPDRLEFRSHGFRCLMLRHPSLGHWCCYVGVPEKHRYFEKPYSDLHIDVHGGLTYSDHVCHVPKPGEVDNIWWLGFDFAHMGDLIPFEYGLSLMRYPHSFPDRMKYYKDVKYVKRECRKVAKQLADMNSPISERVAKAKTIKAWDKRMKRDSSQEISERHSLRVRSKVGKAIRIARESRRKK